MYHYVDVLAHNIFEATHPKKVSQMLPIPEDFTIISVVPVGHTKGLFAINGFLKLSDTAGNDKDDMETKWMKELRGDPEAIKGARD